MNTLIKKRKGPEFLQFIPEKQYLFILEWPKDCNGTKAAIRAGYSKNGAAVTACALLKKAVIQKGLRYFIKPILEKIEFTVEETLKQVSYALTKDIAKFFCSETGRVLHPHELPIEVRSIVDGFKVRSYFNKETGETDQEIEYKLTPHAAARDQALKYHHLLERDPTEGEETKKIDYDSVLGGPGSSSDIIEDAIKGKGE